MPRDRGYSLIELMIAVGIIALVAATGAGLTLASRSLAVTAAASGSTSSSTAREPSPAASAAAPSSSHPTAAARRSPLRPRRRRNARTDDAPGPAHPRAHRRARGPRRPGLHARAPRRRPARRHPERRLGRGRLPGQRHVSPSHHGRRRIGRPLPALPDRARRQRPRRLHRLAVRHRGPAPGGIMCRQCTPPQLPTPPSSAVTCPSGTSPVGTSCVPIGTPTPTPAPPPVRIPTATPTIGATPTPMPTAAPTPTPPIVACDLVESGTCYRRIQGPTLEQFEKEVTPAYTCDDSGMTCQWVNQVGRVIISTRDSYSFQPPVAPSDSAHQLLFVVDGVGAVLAQCPSYQTIRDYALAPPADIPWAGIIGSGISGSNLISTVTFAPGYGQPAIYAYRHVVARSSIPFFGVIEQTESDATQFSQMIDQFADAVQQPRSSATVTSTYSDSAALLGDYITYIPDFTDCASGLPSDRILDDQLYGITSMMLVLEVYQAL